MNSKSLIYLFVMHILIISTFANGVGNEQTNEIDGFLFEFGIDKEKLEVNEKVTMSLSLHNLTTNQPLSSEDLWIRISKDDKILFSSGDFMIKEIGPMFFTYVFPERGEYVLDVAAKYEDKEIKSSFTIDVKSNGLDYRIISMLAIFLLGIFIGFIIRKMRN